MPNSIVFGKSPLPDSYKGTFTEKMLQLLSSGKVPLNGDKDKAMKAAYEAIVGEGIGEGRQGEPLLPLGSDMIPRFKGTQAYLGHALEVFEAVAGNVNVDK